MRISVFVHCFRVVAADVIGVFCRCFLFYSPRGIFACQPALTVIFGLGRFRLPPTFSLFAASPPAVNPDAAAVSMVWSYIGELVFNMLVLVGAVKMADRVVREMMGL